MFFMNANQHHNGQGESSSRSRPLRPSVTFPSCIHCGYNDHHSNDCIYYPTCEICGSYNHNTHGHNRIISLRRGINPRNPQHVTKNCETCGSNVHTTSDHNAIEWFRKRETLQAKNAESFKATTWDDRLEIVEVNDSSFVGISMRSPDNPVIYEGISFSSVGKQLAKSCEAKSLDSSGFKELTKSLVSWLVSGYESLVFIETTSASALSFDFSSSCF
ncbi:hypothetical protein Tco_1431918 [Tanacetum coccineum]